MPAKKRHPQRLIERGFFSHGKWESARPSGADAGRGHSAAVPLCRAS